MPSLISYKKIKKPIMFFVIFVLAFFAVNINVLNVNGESPAVKGLRETAGQGFAGKNVASEAELQGEGVIVSIPTAVGKLIGAVLAFLGVMFLVLMIYGGFLWMFARGNDAEVTKAKGIIESAVIGLVIVLAAYAVTAYLGQALTQ